MLFIQCIPKTFFKNAPIALGILITIILINIPPNKLLTLLVYSSENHGVTLFKLDFNEIQRFILNLSTISFNILKWSMLSS